MTLDPAARWIAPSTPAPPESRELAALTMASAFTRVMSPSSSRMVLPAMDLQWLTLNSTASLVVGDAGGYLWHNEKPLPMAIDWFPLWLSLKVAAVATVISLIAGIWLAWLLANKRFKGKDLLDALTTLPLALPPTVLGYYLLVLIGRTSWIGHAWEAVTGSPLVFTWRAAVIASTLHAIPLLVKSSRAALENVDRAYERAARSLGASEWRLFWRVSIPLARRPIAAATALAFARSLGDFGATLMVAGDIPGRTQTAAIAIFDAVESDNTLVARTLVIVISIVTAGIVYLANRLEQRRHAA
jgi:molybdate transport system permease protein